MGGRQPRPATAALALLPPDTAGKNTPKSCDECLSWSHDRGKNAPRNPNHTCNSTQNINI